VPAVQAVVQKHPRGLFVFVLPNMEINYYAEDVRVRITGNGEDQRASAYRLNAGLPTTECDRTGKGYGLHCGDVYGADAFLITSDKAFVAEIRNDLQSHETELTRRYLQLARSDLADARTFLDLCDSSDPKSRFIDQASVAETLIAGKDARAAHIAAERLFRSATSADLRGKPPYDPAPSLVRRAEPEPLNEDDLERRTARPNLATSANGATAFATFHNWVFGKVATQNHSPALAIDGRVGPEDDAKIPWGGMNSAWVFTRQLADPFPMSTIDLGKSQSIGEIWIRQWTPDLLTSTGIRRVAVEFDDDRSVEFFDLAQLKDAKLVFPPRSTRRVCIIPIEYARDAQTCGILEIEIYAAVGDQKRDARPKHPSRKREQHERRDLTTFGW